MNNIKSKIHSNRMLKEKKEILVTKVLSLIIVEPIRNKIETFFTDPK